MDTRIATIIGGHSTVSSALGRTFCCADLIRGCLARAADKVKAHVSLLVRGEIPAYTVWGGEPPRQIGTRQ
jgi:glucose-6-phosphate dehydrogenase assembly protein OpcA